MTVADDLFAIADRLEAQGTALQDEEFNKPLQLLADAAVEIGKSLSANVNETLTRPEFSVE